MYRNKISLWFLNTQNKIFANRNAKLLEGQVIKFTDNLFSTIFCIFSFHLVLYWWIARVGQNVVEVQVPVLTKWHSKDLKELLPFQVVFFYTLGGVCISVSTVCSWVELTGPKHCCLPINSLEAKSAMHYFDLFRINQTRPSRSICATCWSSTNVLQTDQPTDGHSQL